jgi:hypothetical protein
MKQWRDFKLLAPLAGLLALGGCQDKKEEYFLGGSILGKIIAWEQCEGYHFLVVAVGESWSNRFPKDGWRVVGGEYQGHHYRSLVRLRSQAPFPLGHERTAVGACGFFTFYRDPVTQPCAHDQVPAYGFFDSGAQLTADCQTFSDRR